jgi:hypothetical protein
MPERTRIPNLRLRRPSLKKLKHKKTKTCETAKTQLTPQLTPKSPKQPEIDTQKLSPELAEIVRLWPELPKYIKAAIKALVDNINLREQPK